jgi:hypothetical protein
MQLIRVQKMDLNGVGGPWQELGWKVKGKSWRTKILIFLHQIQWRLILPSVFIISKNSLFKFIRKVMYLVYIIE